MLGVRGLRFILIAVLCAACAGAFDPRTANLSVSLLATGTPAPRLHVLVGRQRIVVPASAPGSGDEQRVFAPPAEGVTVLIALVSESADTVATLSFGQSFRHDHTHWIAAVVGRQRPGGHCIGELVVAPLPGESTDTLFVAYGALPRGAIC